MEDNIKEKESYKYITISGTAQQFEQSITSAVLDGFEVEHINSTPMAIPNQLQQKIDVQIIYSAVLKRKEVLKYGYSKKRYGKEVTKQMDTWLDAIRNLRNICAHHNLLVGKTSSVVLFSSEDDDVTSALNNTDLFSRLYALKKVLNSDDSKLLKKDLNKIIMRSKIDIFKLNILPENWEDIYDSINLL